MKASIHPEYFNDAKIVCACGNVLTVGSTHKEMHVELCSACHPFYTGKKRIVDTAGKVEKFAARAAKTKIMQEKAKTSAVKRKASESSSNKKKKPSPSKTRKVAKKV